MGTWGTAIKSNDTFEDIYGEFFDLYNDGLNVADISKKLIADNQETINEPDDANNFWFALAKAQWECKQLDNEVLKKVKTIIQSGSDIESWRRLDATEKDIAKRKVVLDKFLSEILTDRSKAKSRKKKIIREPVYEKGDCLAFKLANGNYGGVVVIEAIHNTEFGHNLIVTTRINQKDLPTKKNFEDAEVLISNFGNWSDKENINWYLPIRHKNNSHLFDKVCKIDVQLEYSTKDSWFGFVADLDLWVLNQADSQFESEKTKDRPKLKRTIKELTKKKWKLW